MSDLEKDASSYIDVPPALPEYLRTIEASLAGKVGERVLVLLRHKSNDYEYPISGGESYIHDGGLYVLHSLGILAATAITHTTEPKYAHGGPVDPKHSYGVKNQSKVLRWELPTDGHVYCETYNGSWSPPEFRPGGITVPADANARSVIWPDNLPRHEIVVGDEAVEEFTATHPRSQPPIQLMQRIL